MFSLGVMMKWSPVVSSFTLMAPFRESGAMRSSNDSMQKRLRFLGTEVRTEFSLLVAFTDIPFQELLGTTNQLQDGRPPTGLTTAHTKRKKRCFDRRQANGSGARAAHFEPGRAGR